MLDIRTLLVAVAVATAFSALARIALYRLHPSMPGLGRWALASILGAVALGVISFHDAAPVPRILVVPQVLIALAYLLAWDGFRRFLGLRPVKVAAAAAIIAVALMPGALPLAMDARWLHSAVNTGLISGLSAAIAWDLYRSKPHLGLASRLTLWVYAANAAFFGIRCVHVLLGADPAEVGTLQYSPFVAFGLLWWLCMTVAVTLCMILLAGERLEGELKEQANRDPLTGALNRRAFTQVAEAEIARMGRGGQPLALLAMDLDHFKQVNDRLGHATGDEVLRLFVETTGHALRTEDVLCRFGGEEFVALLPGSSPTAAMGVAERIRAGFAAEAARRRLEEGRGTFEFSVSIGVAGLGEAEALDDGLRRADQALYRAKAMGRNRVEPAAQPPHAGQVAFAKVGL